MQFYSENFCHFPSLPRFTRKNVDKREKTDHFSDFPFSFHQYLGRLPSFHGDNHRILLKDRRFYVIIKYSKI